MAPATPPPSLFMLCASDVSAVKCEHWTRETLDMTNGFHTLVRGAPGISEGRSVIIFCF